MAPAAGGAAEMLAVGVAGLLAGNGGGLEEAVVRTALALVIREARQSRSRPEAAKLVRQFLATAVHLRLALDLGEPLEAAAGSFGRLRDGLGRIKALIEAGAAAAGAAEEGPATAGDWQGLTGWTWVTEVMAGLLARLRAGRPAGPPLRFGGIGYVWIPGASGRGSGQVWCGLAGAEAVPSMADELYREGPCEEGKRRPPRGMAAVVHLDEPGQAGYALHHNLARLPAVSGLPGQAVAGFLLAALGVWAADKFLPRRAAPDAWTRQITLHLPVSPGWLPLGHAA